MVINVTSDSKVRNELGQMAKGILSHLWMVRGRGGGASLYAGQKEESVFGLGR